MTPEKQENPLINLAINLIIPAVILSKFTKPEYLGALNGLLVALAFPVAYGIHDFAVRKKANFFSIIGFIGILLTGAIGVFHFPAEWVAYKEASVPLLFGAAVLISLKTPFPLVRKFVYNKELLDVERIDGILEQTGNRPLFEKMLVNATYMLAASFLVSSALNFALAKVIVKSPSGTEAFNEELGKMLALSYPVIALPTTVLMLGAVWYLFRALKKITGLTTDELLAEKLRDEKKPSAKEESKK